MVIAIPSSPTFDRFIEPLNGLVRQADNHRDCPRLSDEDWIALGLQRIVKDVPSSRAFLQKLSFSQDNPIGHTLFFENLTSKRRLDLCREVEHLFRAKANMELEDALAGIDSLVDFDVYAGDGHYQGVSTHETIRSDDKKHPPGHFFALNLRTHCLHHMGLMLEDFERKNEHDMHMLKRRNIEELRQGAAKGRKVLYVWDRAGIDLAQWARWKQGSGIYMLSRQKCNMSLETVQLLDWDEADEGNAGVISDQIVANPQGLQLRRVSYLCAETITRYEFITNLPTSMPPGLVAHLYKMRWDVEKVFDQIKNKFGERRAWSKSVVAKKMQACFICIAHNLMLLFEQRISREEGVRNEPEIRRRAQRLERLGARLSATGLVLPQWQRIITRMTQRSVKFIRWMEEHFWRTTTPWSHAVRSLRHLYARL